MSESRIPRSLGVRTYAEAWDTLSKTREHAFELVDESKTEEDLDASGARLAPYFLKGLDIGPDDVVLEIGCGVGRLGKFIAPHAREWWGLDVSKEMTQIAADRCRTLHNVRFFVGNGADLAGVEGKSVDKICCHAVFIHMDKEDFYTYLLDARRVLRPGGLFYFDVWNLCNPIGWLRWQVERCLYRDKSERPIHRNQFSTPDEVRTMLRMAGWEMLTLEETFSIHATATHIEPGKGYEERFASVQAKYGECSKILKYSEGDRRGFAAHLVSLLHEHGIEPELEVRTSPVAETP